jgi:hypothetical protein
MFYTKSTPLSRKYTIYTGCSGKNQKYYILNLTGNSEQSYGKYKSVNTEVLCTGDKYGSVGLTISGEGTSLLYLW